jgi:PAS domain S-box-containing protein
LIEGKADAISAYLSDEPFNFVMRNLEYRVFTPQSSGIDFYGDVLFTSEDQVRNYPERVAAFVAATKKGWQYAMDNPQEIIELILSRYSQRHSREHLQFEAEKSKALIGREVVEIGYMNPGRWRHIAEKYHELAMLPADISLEGFIYTPETVDNLFWRRVLQLGELVIALLLLWFVIRLIRAHFNLEDLYRKNRIASRRLKKNRRQIAMLLGSMPGMLTGYLPEELVNNVKADYADFIVPGDLARIRQVVMQAIEAGKPYNLTYRIVDAAGQQKWVWDQGQLSSGRKKRNKTRIVEGFISDISEAKKLEAENQRAIADLQQALGEIKVLRGIIPICSSCKKIRDDKGLWNQVEQYLKDHTDSEFSHSICPECAAKMYPRQNG